MATIPVPKPPASAYNPKRRASQLLKDQVQHLEWAVRPASQRQREQIKRIKPPKTEAEAAARIQQLTQQLHPEGARAVALPAPTAAKPPRAKRRARPSRKGSAKRASRRRAKKR